MAEFRSCLSFFDQQELFSGSGTVLVRKNGVQKGLEHTGRGIEVEYLKKSDSF